MGRQGDELDKIVRRIVFENANDDMWRQLSELYLMQAKALRLAFDATLSQGFDEDRAFDLAINLVLTQFENSLKNIGDKTDG